MIAHPSVDTILHGDRGIVVGIAACMREKCVMSALTLLYSAIDVVSGLSRPVEKKENDSEDFKAWVTEYYLQFSEPGISKEDLWGARCGVVHTYSPVGRDVLRGTARKLVYKWRDGHRPDDALLEAYRNAPNTTIVEIEGLVEAFESAVEMFHVRIGADPELARRVDHHVGGLLCYEPWKPVLINLAA